MYCTCIDGLCTDGRNDWELPQTIARLLMIVGVVHTRPAGPSVVHTRPEGPSVVHTRPAGPSALHP